MNSNSALLTVEQLPGGGGLAQFPLTTFKAYYQNEKEIKIRECTSGGNEYVFNLEGAGKGIGVINGNFCIGSLTLNGPTSTKSISVFAGSDRASFQHHGLSNVFSPNLSETPGVDAEFLSIDDIRDDCGLGVSQNPQIHRFLLSKAFVHLKVEQEGGNNMLRVTFQANAFNSGYDFLVKTV